MSSDEADNDGIEEGDEVQVTIDATVVDVHDDGALWVDADGVEFEVGPREWQRSGTTRNESEDECLYCLGAGTVKRRYGTAGSGPAKITKTRECPNCGGTGTNRIEDHED